MQLNTNQLTIYRNFNHQQLFDDMVWIINNYTGIDNNSYENNSGGKMETVLFNTVNRLVDFAVTYGFEGNLWHSFLTFLLVDSENPFSRACEITGIAGGTINQLAMKDFTLFRQLYGFDLLLIDKQLGINCFRLVTDYRGLDKPGSTFDVNIRENLWELSLSLARAADAESFFHILTDFYKRFGAGRFGMYKAFRVNSAGGRAEIDPITNTENIVLNDLVGYELQKKELIKNTLDFVQDRKANNVLLYGDSGTGKSSSIKAILNEYSPEGLRMIEVYKHQFGHLSEIIEQLRGRNYKFIIFMDDLSFEDYETEYKYLKAVIEGGLEVRPDNVLLYATSNRRHLIREKWSDKADRDDDLHTNDTVQEKLSLASRFGLSILYISPNKREFDNIVKVLAQKHNITLPEDQLLLEANRWELRHGGLSGRTAQHFITYLAGSGSTGV